MPHADDMLAVAASRTSELAAPGLSPRPRRRVAVLACMDTRIDLFPMLGLERGDAHIIRNAGGLVTDDALRSLSASQRLLGTEEIVVVMHDGCGLLRRLRGRASRRRSPRTACCRTGVSAHSRTSRRRSRHSLARLRASRELTRHEHIRGFVFDPENGERCARSRQA